MSASLGSLYFYLKKGIRLQGARKPLLNFYKEGVEGGGYRNAIQICPQKRKLEREMERGRDRLNNITKIVLVL